MNSSVNGSTPRFAKSGIWVSIKSGSNTTTSPKVRGSTNHNSLTTTLLFAKCITTCVCGGLTALGLAIINLPLMRRCIISFCPESKSQIKYLPRREAVRICTPVRPSINASRLVRRTVRSRPTSTLTTNLPTTFSCKPRRTVSTSGSSGTFCLAQQFNYLNISQCCNRLLCSLFFCNFF